MADTDPLVEQLLKFGVAEAKARELYAAHTKIPTADETGSQNRLLKLGGCLRGQIPPATAGGSDKTSTSWCGLHIVSDHREAAEAQIAAYPYRDPGKPRKNAAGWLIAAIEGNFTLPVTYLEDQEKKQQAAKSAEAKIAAAKCRFCDEKGWRRVRTPNYPSGAMKRCTHDAKAEAKYENA